MDEIAELRGRLVMLETVLAAAITHVAATVADPDRLIAAIMSNAEDNLERAEAAAEAGDRQAAQFARGAFDALSDALARHLTQGKPRA